MKRYRVIITPFAGENIRMAFDWLEVESPVYAAQWLAGISRRISELATLPESHVIAPESESFDCEIRQLLYGRGTPWRIFFTIEGSTVHVLHVRHGNRDYWQP